jgi:hypothetical protein
MTIMLFPTKWRLFLTPDEPTPTPREEKVIVVPHRRKGYAHHNYIFLLSGAMLPVLQTTLLYFVAKQGPLND